MTDRFEFVGNSPILWRQVAEGLIYNAEVLKQHRYQRQQVGVSDALNVYRTFSELLLWGYAVEVFLKCLFLKRVGPLVKDGKLVMKHHNLVKWAGDAEYSLTDSQHSLLKRLSEIIRWGGRYPIPTKSEDLSGRWWGSPEDDDVLERLIKSLRLEIEGDD